MVSSYCKEFCGPLYPQPPFYNYYKQKFEFTWLELAQNLTEELHL